MKVIVTGGCGFIGSHLTNHLIDKGIEVVVIDNLSNGRVENLNDCIKSDLLTIVKADISIKKLIERYFENTSIVFHLAALADIVPSIEEPIEYFNSNVLGTINVVELSRKYNIGKIVYAASSSSYGIAKKMPTNEFSKIDPQYPYAFTKHQAEQIIFHWSKVYKIQAISLRLFNVFGPRSRTTGTYGAVFGVFLAQKLSKKPLTIVGDGTQKRDFTYVSDVVNAFYLAGKLKVTGEVINIGSGKPQSVNYLANLLGGEKIYIKKRPGEPDCTCADIQKAKEKLNWTPKITFEEGVRIMIKNIDWWRDAPVWTPKKIESATKEWFKYLK
jgi:UDP-glucose 4-epimerase